LSIDDSLRRVAKGELLDDEWTRRTYSVDASHYEVMPEAILCPIDDLDVQQACQYASARGVAITARGAGTGLLGQALSDGIILDFSKHMSKILQIEDSYVVVQPGIVKTILDIELRKKGKFLPVDPASSNYCTVGGMIADNSSGVHCLGYGNTIDFLDDLDFVYADGTFGYAGRDRYDEKMARLRDLLGPHLGIIRKSYPNVSKNSCGYRLDAVVKNNSFLPHKIFAASEGTLGVITRAKFRIQDIPENRCMLVLGFADLLAALRAVPGILGHSPVAFEMMDRTALSPETRSAHRAGCILFVEFAGAGHNAEKRLDSCIKEFSNVCQVLEYASDEQSLTKIWNARKGALNNIMKLTVGSRKPVGLIEDTVVRPGLLVDHASELLRAYRENNLEYVMYGHVGDGNMHTRPLIDISSRSEIELMDRIAENIFAKVIAAGGSITGEHGDGIARVRYIRLMYGQAITEIFYSIKKLLDPQFTLNPGKKVPSPKLK